MPTIEATSIHEAWRRAVLLCLKNSRDAEARALSIEICFHDGADDRVFPPEHSRAIAELIPNAQLEIIEGTGHGLLFERADRVMELMA